MVGCLITESLGHNSTNVLIFVLARRFLVEKLSKTKLFTRMFGRLRWLRMVSCLNYKALHLNDLLNGL